MPEVNVPINGRAYMVACDDGEEKHLRELGEFFDKRAKELCASVGQVSDTRLLLMTGLVISDELLTALAKLQERDTEIAVLKSQLASPAEFLEKSEDRIAEVLDSAALRIESIAARGARA
jgi:cell division protein ZapA